MEVSIMET